MRALLIALCLALLPATAPAETIAAKQGRYRSLLSKVLPASSAEILRTGLANAYWYDTAAELTADSSAPEGLIGYAIDTNAHYLRQGSSWVAISALASMANGAVIANAVDGTITITEGGEVGTWTVTNNLISLGSSSSATYAFTPAVGFTADVTLSGGAGALTCGAAGCSLLATDASATGFIMGATGATNILTVDTTDAAPKIIVTGITTQDAFSVPVGESVFVEGIRAPIVATSRVQLRFCGNLSVGATSVFASPVQDRSVTNYEFGGTGCDGEDSTTETTADEPWYAPYAIKPIAMTCVAVCTGASAANDAPVFQLRSAAASVTGMTCTAPAFGGDGVPTQCSVRDSSPATVATGATWALQVTLVDDACTDAGDDFECLVDGTF